MSATDDFLRNNEAYAEAFDSGGLPIGLQIVGRRHDDVGVLALARAYEDIRSADMRPWPEPPGRADMR